MLYKIPQLIEFRNNFVEEVEQAAVGVTNSLVFQKNWLKPFRIKDSSKAQILSISGANIFSARCLDTLDKDLIEIKQTDLPMLSNAKMFLDIILDITDADTEVLAISLAFPLEQTIRGKKMDGKLIKATKEHLLIDLIGKEIGKEIEQYFVHKLDRKLDVVVCNNSIALGFIGLALNQSGGYKQTAVGIIGSGLNFGFYEGSDLFVNLEAGNFDKFESTHSGDVIDSLSQNYGQQLFEKETSAAYLYKHFNVTIREEGFLQHVSSTKELSQILAGGVSDSRDYKIASKIFERSASLVATQISGLHQVLINHHNLQFEDPIQLIVEGELFWNGFKYEEMIADYLDRIYGDVDEDFNIEIKKLENMNLLGASMLLEE
jgi:hexokinase